MVLRIIEIVVEVVLIQGVLRSVMMLRVKKDRSSRGGVDE